MELLGVAAVGTRFLADARDRFRVKLGEIARRLGRSSSGASSRKVYGRPLRISFASGDGSVVSRKTGVTVPLRKPSKSRTSPSASVASWRQSCIVWRTIG